MSVVYFDASALVKLLLEEPGSPETFELWQQADLVACSRLSYPEVGAASAAALRNRDLSYEGIRRAEHLWEELWARVRPVELTSRVELFAGTLAREQALGGADAVHFASALTLPHDSLVFTCWDRRLYRAAKRLELTVATRVIPAGTKSA